ncbi:MAG: hypothetical protein HGA78_12125 [Nitrospirales bacterium]|nr:hypothetical protein [Nitrospirales bacterium]
MRRAGMLGVVICFGVMTVAGCTHSVRYTTEEIKDYPMDVQEQIMREKVSLGMTAQQVRYAWGSPESIRPLGHLEGKKREEWVYSTMGVWDTKTLVFLDGRLIYISGETPGKKDTGE